MSDSVDSAELPEGTLEELQEQLDILAKANSEVEEKLANSFGAAMQPADKVNLRLTCMMNMTMPPELRVKIEIMTQTVLAPILANMYAEVEKQFKEFEKQRAQQAFLQGVPGIDPSALGSPLIG
jgi:hypothetical protein